MSIHSTLKSLLTGFVFASILFTAGCNHKDNEINATCFDEKLNQEEERVDCGGPNCPPCPPTCDDGILNQDEQYIDCGGPNCDPCGTCSDGVQSANWHAATNSFVMEQGVDCGFPCPNFCQPTCDDGIQNGDEEGIDCGGICGTPCPPPTCNDGVWNGNETGVDCGGPDCPPCPVPSCNDGIMNQDETGIDCGGICGTPCPVPTCSDGIMNGNETGVDCGGGCPTQCPDESCNDGIMNNGEEWIDCGGPNCPNVCPTCDDGVQNGPEAGIDCVIGDQPDYYGGTCPPCETCNDGILNQDETSIDCGGTVCDECEMYLNATSANGSPFIGSNFQVQPGFDAITFTATQVFGEFSRQLVLRVPTTMEEGDAETVGQYTFGFGAAVQFTNPNGVVFESVEVGGYEMQITLKQTAPTWGPKRIEGSINMVDLEDVDFTSTATTTITGITFGINY